MIDPVALVKRYHDALNHYDATVVAPMIAEHAVYHSPGVGLVEGRDSIIAAFNAYFAEHPDQVSVDDTVVGVGNRAARAEWRLTATSKSTGEPYFRRGFETVTFNDLGLISRVEVDDR